MENVGFQSTIPTASINKNIGVVPESPEKTSTVFSRLLGVMYKQKTRENALAGGTATRLSTRAPPGAASAFTLTTKHTPSHKNSLQLTVGPGTEQQRQGESLKFPSQLSLTDTHIAQHSLQAYLMWHSFHRTNIATSP